MLSLIFAIVIPFCTECISPRHEGYRFFNHTKGIAYARWNGRDAFVVESVLQGGLEVNEKLPHQARTCDFLEDAKLYLVSRFCATDRCDVVFARENDAPRLLRFLEHAHPETHEAIMAKLVAWAEGSLTRDQFGEWLGTAAIEPRAPDEDDFVSQLMDELLGLINDAAEMPKERTIEGELREVAKLARSFPAGTSEEFDEKLEKAGDQDSRERGEYDDALLKAIEVARTLLIRESP